MTASVYEREPDRRDVSLASRRFPVVEAFGPTVQGEGPDAGRPAYFVRFGGCDYRCTWCDSMYAVDPAAVRAQAAPLTIGGIMALLGSLKRGPSMTVLTGGNPALLELGELVRVLHAQEMDVSVETQGSVWRDWLRDVDRLVVSPKGPSSGMHTARHGQQFDSFMDAARGNASPVLKVVVFDDSDLDWAQTLASVYDHIPLYVSAGTDVGLDDADTRERLINRYRWLCESVSRSPSLARARVLPQLHVLAWGTARGV